MCEEGQRLLPGSEGAQAGWLSGGTGMIGDGRQGGGGGKEVGRRRGGGGAGRPGGSNKKQSNGQIGQIGI